MGKGPIKRSFQSIETKPAPMLGFQHCLRVCSRSRCMHVDECVTPLCCVYHDVNIEHASLISCQVPAVRTDAVSDVLNEAEIDQLLFFSEADVNEVLIRGPCAAGLSYLTVMKAVHFSQSNFCFFSMDCFYH